MGCWKILARKGHPGSASVGPTHGSSALPTPLKVSAYGTVRRSRREGGWSLFEVALALFLVIAISVFGFRTMNSGWTMQNWSIMQSMTDAYAGIETAYAQRWTFADIPTSGRWPLYPASSSIVATLGKTPKALLKATVVRTSHRYTDLLTGAQSYMLESYVVYQDELRQYCKVSKVYRTE